MVACRLRPSGAQEGGNSLPSFVDIYSQDLERRGGIQSTILKKEAGRYN